MGVPVDITRFEQWRVYAESASWPSAPDHMFIVEAAERMLQVKFGLDGADVADDPWSVGYRDEVANSMSGLLMKGSLIGYVRAMGDNRLSPLAVDWTPETAIAAIATGIVRRTHGRKRQHPHWVFVGRREVEVLAKVYAATDMLFPQEDAGPTEALAETVLASLGAMVGNPSATPRDGASSVVQLLLPASGWTLHPHDRDQFAEAVVPWLFRAFERVGREAGKDDFAAMAISEHKPFLTGRIFENVWAKAKKLATAKNAPVEHKAHAFRFVPGPKSAG